MFLKTHQTAATITLLLISSAAIAIPFGSFDTRSMAMGGAGVAVGGADAAPLFNPALLSVANDKDRFALIVPTIGIRISDSEKLRDSINSFQNSNVINQMSTDITALNTAINALPPVQANITAAANKVGADITTVSNQLTTLSDKPITAEMGLATVVGVPSKKLGAAFYASGAVTAGGLFQYKDAATLATQSALASTCATDPNPVTQAAACNTLAAFNPNDPNTGLKSGIHFKGVVLGEVGVSLSREIQISDHTVALGITPKIVQAKLFDTVINVNSANQTNLTGSDFIADYNYFNFDVGAAKSYDNGWRTGVVLKNVIPKNLDFKFKQSPTGESLSLKPQARIGVSRTNSWSTVALDVDLTRNDPAGLEKGSQYIALGGELNAFNWAQLRAGYRLDLANSARNVTSIGLGLAPFGVLHADLAVAGNANEIGGSFQLGMHF